MPIIPDTVAIDYLLRGCNTNTPFDTAVQAFVLRLFKATEDQAMYGYAQRLIMEKRREWLYWYTKNQAHWQNVKSVNINHDSYAMRESYLAPHTNYMDERAFEARATAYNLKRQPRLYTKREAK